MQGLRLRRFLWVQAAKTAARTDPELRCNYQRLQFRCGRAGAQVAIARKWAVRLYGRLKAGSEVEPRYGMRREAASCSTADWHAG